MLFVVIQQGISLKPGGCTDFEGFLVGYYNPTLPFATGYYHGHLVRFWTATEDDEETSMFRELQYDEKGVGRYSNTKEGGSSVRCLKN